MGFFSRNIETKGRIFRAASGVCLLVAGVFMAWHIWWVSVILLATAAFVLFEAFRGWCFLRACGIKTKF
jgi:hypothetical protein